MGSDAVVGRGVAVVGLVVAVVGATVVVDSEVIGTVVSRVEEVLVAEVVDPGVTSGSRILYTIQI